MQRSSTDQLNLEMPPVTQDNNVDNRSIRLLSYLTSGVPTVISIFCIGLVSGAAGGVLLGATAVVLLQSLELLADNSTLIDQLERFTKKSDRFDLRNEQVRGIQMSLFVVIHGVLSSILSVAVGLFIGYSTMSLSEREQIERKGEAVSGKALTVAGSVCLMVVTGIGCLLGFTLESFLSIGTLYGDICLLIIFRAVALMIVITIWCVPTYVSAFLLFMYFTLFAALVASISILFFKIRLFLASIFVPVTAAVNLLQKSQTVILHTITVRLMLIISDVYNVAGQRIVALQSPTSTTTSSVVEAIFVGVLASLMWTVTVGMSLFVAWQRGGAGKICATAAATGSAALGVIKLALPVLGPGPLIGALIGVAGAAGVSLAAAGAATDQYRRVVHRCGLFGRLGVTVGAAVGAFFMSCAHSGLSAMVMAVCAATVPAGAFLLMFVQSTSLGLKGRLYLHLVPAAAILFTYAGLFYMMPSNSRGFMFVAFIIYSSIVYFWDDFWSYKWVLSKE